MASIRLQRITFGIGGNSRLLNSIVCRNSRCLSLKFGPKSTEVGDVEYPKDSWTNTTPRILSYLDRNLHLQESHPVSLTRQIIESNFPQSTYSTYNTFSPIVTKAANFDSLGFPPDHPGRSKSDTYYLNSNTLLRTHTSAHQADVFRDRKTPGFLISADVYRRDAIDRSHYPVFHQMEGARTWDRTSMNSENIASAVDRDLAEISSVAAEVEDECSEPHPVRNPKQDEHSLQEAKVVGDHLKRTLERVVLDIFTRAKAASSGSAPETMDDEPLKMRWVEAYFPFTTPSWELEVFWQGEWLEVLGCGVIKHSILQNAGRPNDVGWAFGIGLERIAMLLFGIPDIRLFWSEDPRFLDQFKDVNLSAPTPSESNLRRFVPFSKYPAMTRDVSFWLPPGTNAQTSSSNSDASAAGGDSMKESGRKWGDIHENDIMEIVREVGGNVVEDVKLIDEFVKKSDGKEATSLAYRITYRSLESTLHSKQVAKKQMNVEEALKRLLCVRIR